MGTYNCERCGKLETVDVVPRRGKICFGCHVKTVNVGFAHGKEDFHGPTIRERQRHQEAQAKSAGINAEPVGTRWV